MEDGELERVGGEHLERRDGVSAPQPEDALLPQHSPAHAPHAPRRSGSRERGVPRASCAMVLARSSGGRRRFSPPRQRRRRRRDAATRARRRSRSRPTGAAATSQFHVAFSPAMCAGVTTPPTDETPPARLFRRRFTSRRGAPPSRRASSRVALAAPTGARGGEGVVRGESPRGGVDGSIVAGGATDGGPRGADGRVASTIVRANVA